MTEPGTAVRHDLRLALPAGLAWAALAVLSWSADAVRVLAWGAPVVAVVAIGVGATVPRRRPRVRAGAALLALAAALAALLGGAGARVADAGLDACGRLSAVVLGGGATPDVLVTRCDERAIAVPAVLARAPSNSTAPGDEQPSALAPGDELAGPCDAWLDGIRWIAACPQAAIRAAEGGGGWIAALRTGLAATATRLPGDGGALLPGLAIGDTSGVDATLDRAMLDAGLSHLTAVSGANCAIVVAAVLGLGAALRVPRLARGAAAVAALAGFVALVTPEPSVVRAAIMAAIAVVALVAGSAAAGLPLVALAVVVAIAAAPSLATSAGFALSVLATVGLVVHARPLARLLRRWMPSPLALLVAVPVAAQLWCLPVLVTLDARVSGIAVLANLLAAPAAPVATVLGLVVCLVAPIAPQLAAALAWLAWVPAAWIGGVARASAEAPLAVLPWPAAPWGAALGAGVVGLVVVGHARGRLAIGAAAATLVLAIGAGIAAWPALRFRASLGEWSIAQCDVGQGSATVVREGEATMLIDAGREPARLEACLDLLDVGRVAMFVLTHFDADHAGGASALVGRVDLLVHGPLDERAVAIVREHEAGGAVSHEARRGDTWMFGGASTEHGAADAAASLRLEALWPEGRAEPGNDASVAVAVDTGADGSTDLIVLGDLGAAAQARLLHAGVPSAPVVVVSHHGSADQLPALYRAIDARVALIGVGPNDYGHPTPHALAIARDAGGVALRTDELGTIALALRGGAAEVWTERTAVVATARKRRARLSAPRGPPRASRGCRSGRART